MSFVILNRKFFQFYVICKLYSYNDSFYNSIEIVNITRLVCVYDIIQYTEFNVNEVYLTT